MGGGRPAQELDAWSSRARRDLLRMACKRPSAILLAFLLKVGRRGGWREAKDAAVDTSPLPPQYLPLSVNATFPDGMTPLLVAVEARNQ